jgi:hypothetical protein
VPVVFQLDSVRQNRGDEPEQRFRFAEIFLRREVNSVRIRLEHGAAVLRKFVDQHLQQLAAAPRDFRRQLAIAKPRSGKPEVAVERVDQDLEIRLPRLRLRALLLTSARSWRAACI